MKHPHFPSAQSPRAADRPHPSLRKAILATGIASLAFALPSPTFAADPPTIPTPAPAASPAGFAPLFPQDGVPAGWMVRSWNDVSLPAPPSANWKVTSGTLQAGAPRGTWLVSAREYGDFILDFEFRLGERGQGGVGIRFPMAGDPAFEGLEVQMVDPRFYGTNHTAQPWELTGALFKAVPPTVDAYKPLDWNHYTIECRGSTVSVTLNGKKVIDIDLARATETPARGKPLAERPRRGRIGFQEVSRGDGRVEIRNARIQVLNAG